MGSFEIDVTSGRHKRVDKSSSRNISRPELFATATCHEKLMWKLLPHRTKWKAEHFRCFLMIVGSSRRNELELEDYVWGLEEFFLLVLVYILCC